MKTPTKNRNKRGRPKVTGEGRPFLVRLHNPLHGAIEKWRQAQEDKPSVPDALRRLAALYLGLPEDVADQKKLRKRKTLTCIVM